MNTKYYIVEKEYVGPLSGTFEQDFGFLVYGHYYVVRDEPANQEQYSGEWTATPRGGYESLAEALAEAERLAESHGVGHRYAGHEYGYDWPRYYVGDDQWAALYDASAFLADTTDADLGLHHDTDDEAIERLVAELESDAEANGFRLWGCRRHLEARLDDLRHPDHSEEDFS